VEGITVKAFKIFLAAMAVIALLAVPAAAQTPADDAYTPNTVIPLGGASLPPTVLSVSDTSSDKKDPGGASLPLTGLQIAFVLGAGGALVLLAVGMSRSSSRRTTP
jgi:hypothetical protein